jgi:hypothetical protein
MEEQVQVTQEQMEKAVANYQKRMQYNAAWRERNPEKVKAARSAYNKRKWAQEKTALAQARAAGLL